MTFEVTYAEIEEITKALRSIIDEIGVEEFCKRIKEALENHTGEYKINGRCCDICDNMNK